MNQIALIDRAIRDVKAVRDRHEAGMRARACAARPERDNDGDTLITDVFDDFRSKKIDPSQVKTVTLQSGTYIQVPSRYATIGNTVSVHSTMNKSDVPGGAHQGISPDKRFGVLGTSVPFGGLAKYIQQKKEERKQELVYQSSRNDSRGQYFERARPRQPLRQTNSRIRNDPQLQFQHPVQWQGGAKHGEGLEDENLPSTRRQNHRTQSGQIRDRQRRMRYMDKKDAEDRRISQVDNLRRETGSPLQQAQGLPFQNYSPHPQSVMNNDQNSPAQTFDSYGYTMNAANDMGYPYQASSFAGMHHHLGHETADSLNQSIRTGLAQMVTARNNSVQNTGGASLSYRPRGLSKDNVFYEAQQLINQQVAADWKAREEKFAVEWAARQEAEAAQKVREEAETKSRAHACNHTEDEYNARISRRQIPRRVLQQQANREYARHLDELNEASRTAGLTKLMGDAISGQPTLEVGNTASDGVETPTVLKTMFSLHIRKPTNEVEAEWQHLRTPPRLDLHSSLAPNTIQDVARGSPSLLSPVEFGDTFPSLRDRNSVPLRPSHPMISPTESFHSDQNAANRRLFSLPGNVSPQPSMSFTEGSDKENQDPLAIGELSAGSGSGGQVSRNSSFHTIFGLLPGTISREISPSNGSILAARGRRLFDVSNSRMSSPGAGTIRSSQGERRTSSADRV